MATQKVPPRNSESSRSASARQPSPLIENYVAVARGPEVVIIRIVGRGNMLNAPALQEFSDEQRLHGYSHFLFDFAECTGLDSTFMGVMVGLHHADDPHSPSSEIDFETIDGDPLDLVPLSPDEALAQLTGMAQEDRQRGSTVSAVNVSKEIKGLLSMLGVDNFMAFHRPCDLSRLEMTPLPEKLLTPAERRELIFKAHETLVEIDKRNEAQFGDMLRQFSREMNPGPK